MSIRLLELVPEIREQIYKFLDIPDLVNIMCCSKAYHETVKYIFWHFLKVKWKLMKDKNVVIEKTRYLSMTIQLYFYSYKKIEDEEKDGIAASYEYMIKKCNPDTLVSLHFSEYIVEDALSFASQILPNIQEMSLCDISDMPNVLDWNNLCNFKQLKRLSIYSCNLPDSCLENFKSLIELVELIMIHCSDVTNDALKYVSEVPNLQKLNFSNHNNHMHMPAECDGYAYTANLVNLTELNFSYSDIDYTPFDAMSQKLKNVTTLDLIACRYLSGEAIEYISKLVSLKQLDISYCQEITDDSLEHLSALTKLFWLSIGGNRSLTDEGLFNISKVSSLKHLNLSACINITNAGLYHVSQLPILNWFNIWGCEKITDEGLVYISKVTTLTDLNVSKCIKIEDTGLLNLTKLVSLKWLHILGCPNVTDIGVSYVTKLPSLTELDISYLDNLTDNGLLQIQNLKSLQAVHLFGCKKVTDEGIENVKKFLPSRIEFNIDRNRDYSSDDED